jgi:hypothetical protein
MTMNYTTSYAQIVKYDTNEDGTLMVYGKATDDTLDLDSQICDAAWLDEAMPKWFKSGGNIREMHGPSAAGIAKEYESKNDGHYIGVHVVDPIAAKKVETGVYQGFSIGIKSPRVVRDNKAANGRIIDGQIIEVSLVDRPANPSAKLILAKSVEGESSLVQVEELHEYKAPLPSDIAKHGDHDQSDHNPNSGGGGSDKPSGDDRTEDHDMPNMGEFAGTAQIDSARDDARDLRESLQNNPHDDVYRDRAERDMAKAQEKLNTARDAGTKQEAKDALRGALKEVNRAFQILEDQNYKGEAQAAHELAISVTQALVAIKSATITKHGDHDQSDHNPNSGGGGSSSEDKPEGSSSGAAATFDSLDKELGESIDTLEEFIEDAEDPDNDLFVGERDMGLAQGAQDDADKAYAMLDSVRNEDAARQYNTVSQAAERLSDAGERLQNADNAALNRMGSDFMDTAAGLETYLETLVENEGKSLTTKEPIMARQRRAAKSAINKEEGMGLPMNGESKAIPSRDEMIERYAAARKAVDAIAAEAKSHGYDDMEKAYGETAEEETAEGPAVAAETAEEEVREAEEQKPADEAKAVDAEEDKADDEDEEKKKVSEDDESEDDEVVKSLIEKAVKSAMDSVKVEIDTLLAEKKSAVEKSVKLESDLATALSKSVAGGPKRTATKMSDAAQNDLLVKAATYKAKAEATTDPVLAKGYRELANDFIAKANPKTEN